MTDFTERTTQLLTEFGERIDQTGFTAVGLPPEAETQLIKDVWEALTVDEQQAILERIRQDTQGWLSDTPVELPEPTPYAMRLTLRYLTIMRKRQLSS